MYPTMALINPQSHGGRKVLYMRIWLKMKRLRSSVFWDEFRFSKSQDQRKKVAKAGLYRIDSPLRNGGGAVQSKGQFPIPSKPYGHTPGLPWNGLQDVHERYSSKATFSFSFPPVTKVSFPCMTGTQTAEKTKREEVFFHRSRRRRRHLLLQKVKANNNNNNTNSSSRLAFRLLSCVVCGCCSSDDSAAAASGFWYARDGSSSIVELGKSSRLLFTTTTG